MTSAAENLTRITGRVLSRATHPRVPRWDELTLEVSQAAPVAGERNMLGETVGSRLTVVANRDELPPGDLSGWQFDGKVRVAGPDVVEVPPVASGAGAPSLTPPAGAAEPPAPPEPPASDGPDGDGGPVPVL